MLAVLAAAGRAGATEDRDGRLQACFIGFNEPDEVEVFRSHLDPQRFEFVDLRALSPARPGASASGTEWLLDACVPAVHCDLLVISGEFAGHFFGTRGSVSLEALEEASCQARCAGLFRRPREVFLLACNTLATKDQDRRMPEEYLHVLLEHDFDRAMAERVVALRYGPLGPSFRESVRRIFAGVPHIYGFSSVSPRAEFTAPMLERYLHATPDYAAALARDSGPSTALPLAFAGTTLVETTGLAPGESGARERDFICALYDESRSLDERLRIAYGLSLRPDALRFVPTLQGFLARHPSERFGRMEVSIFAEIQAADDARAAVLELVHGLDISALQLELAHFAAMVGWLERAEVHALAVAAATELLQRQLSAESVDVMCEVVKHESLRDDFDADDFAAHHFSDPQGLRMIGCLAPADPRVAARLLPTLRGNDPVLRAWAAYAVMQVRPSDPGILAALEPYRSDPAPEVASRIAWLLDTQARQTAESIRH